MPYKKKNIENNTENIKVDNTASEVKNDTESNVDDNVKISEKIVERIIEKPVEEDNRLDKKINVRSIAPWITGAPRVTTNGDISVPPKGTVLLSREEVIAQAQNGNRLINGTDSVGSHATWYIDDVFTRSELSFDMPDENKSQIFLTRNIVKEIFAIKSQKDFESEIENRVVTRAEKAYLIECIKEFNFNDYRKIDFCVKYTGIEP